MNLVQRIEAVRMPQIRLGMGAGIGIGTLAAYVAGPEIAAALLDVCKAMTENQGWYDAWTAYQQALLNPENSYMVGVALSIVPVSLTFGAVGTVAGVYDKVRDTLGYEPFNPLENSWGDRRIREFSLIWKYTSEGKKGKDAVYHAAREAAAETIAETRNLHQRTVEKALDTLAEQEETKATILFEHIADFAREPEKYTFSDRLAVASPDVFFVTGMGCLYAMGYAFQTGSLVKTVIAGIAGATLGFSGGTYLDSEIQGRLLSHGLREEKEERKKLYQQFEVAYRNAVLQLIE